MTLISNSKFFNGCILSFISIGIFFLGNLYVYAEEATQTLSVSPTLFQMTATRDQVWKSEVRVINVNTYDITVYPQVVNFAPAGEAGRGDFIPIMSSETGGQTLAEWIDIDKDGIVIAPQSTAVVPFTVYVPGTAAPGGHYAAILIGTKPADPNAAESVVKTAQFVTALFFMRVAGEVTESGSIREFRTTKTLLQKPEANFEVRFQNTGNVHLQPQGDIEIFNMWNEERGTIPINHQTHFGNVLPNSIRKFEFAWKTEGSAFDIGRYRAVVTLGYGDDIKSFVTSSTYFWIVPYKEILIVLSCLVIFIWVFAVAVKMYVRRMLLLSGISPQQLPARMVASIKAGTPKNTVHVARYLTVTAPVRMSLQDIVRQLKTAPNVPSFIRVCFTSLRTHWLFFVAILTLLGASLGVAFLWSRAHTEPRPYEVTIGNSDSPITLSSESIYYDNLKSQSTVEKSATVPEFSEISIAIVNVSGELGKAAKLRLKLESEGYTVASVTGDLARSDTSTKIIYHPDNEEAAVSLGKRLGGVLLSADPQATNSILMIYVGKDQLPE